MWTSLEGPFGRPTRRTKKLRIFLWVRKLSSNPSRALAGKQEALASPQAEICMAGTGLWALSEARQPSTQGKLGKPCFGMQSREAGLR